ncbi:MAG: TROVE domain-containing protein [Candidatus Doudnabacteria bacterium]
MNNIQAKKTNFEGGETFDRSLREQVIQNLMVGTSGDTFYASKRELSEQAESVLRQGIQEDPEFVAKAAVYARNHGLIKDAPVKALAMLAAGRGKTKSAFEAAFNLVIRIPDDLRKFALQLSSGSIAGKRGLGGFAKVAVRGWMSNISEHHAVKYGSQSSKGMTLRDLIKMSHPKPQNEAMSERFGWLIRGNKALGANPELNPQIRALEALKQAQTEEQVIALIRQGRLPFEVVVPAVQQTTPGIWRELLFQAPYMNLLRNLVTFTRHDVFRQEDVVSHAVTKLIDQDQIKRSKVLPFRFFDAYNQYSKQELKDSRILDALREACNSSFVNLSSFGSQNVAIAPDVSGSMNSTFGKGDTAFIDIAGVFTGALLRQIKNRAIVLPFETRVRHDHSISVRDDVLVTAEK